MGEQKDNEFYDRIFSTKGKWTSHYTKSSSYSLWQALVKHITPDDRILEIAFGTGRLAHMIHTNCPITDYVGIDFSKFGTEYAKKLTPAMKFIHGDIFKSQIIETTYFNTVIATEFLEHVHDDLIVINRLKSLDRQIKCLFTVPAGQSLSIGDHVRQFLQPKNVYERYGPYISHMELELVKPRYLITGVI